MVKIAHWLFDQKYKAEKLLFSLFLLFLPTQLGKHFWPSYSYLLGIRSDYLSPTFYFTDVLLVALFLVWFINERKYILSMLHYLLSINYYVLKNFSLSNNTVSIYQYIGLFVYLLVTGLFVGNIWLGSYALWKLIECLFIGIYIAKRSTKIISLANVIFFLSLGAIGESFLAIAQFVNQGSINGIFYFFGERSFNSQTIGIANMSLNGQDILRPYATFSHPNVLAGYLLVISTLSLFAYWKNYKYFFSKPIFFLFTFFLCSLVMLITYSRVAILCWALTTVLLIYLQLKDNRQRIFLFTTIFICLVFLAWHLQLLQRFSSLSLTDESVTQRQILLSASWELLTRHIFLGVGLYNFLPALSELPMMQLNFFLLQPVHNIFVLVVVETGIIGFVIFIYFLTRTIVFLFRYAVTIKRVSFSLICLLLLSQIFITGMFDHYWLTLQQGQLLFSLVLGLSWHKKYLLE